MSVRFYCFLILVDPKPFEPHECGLSCLSDPDYIYNEKRFRGSNPLLIPIMLGWQRELVKHKTGQKRNIFYRAPCGRRLRDLSEVHEWAAKLLMILALGHAAMAVFHQVVRKDGTLTRMLRPG